MQCDGAGVQDEKNVHGQDGAWQSEGHGALQPRCERAEGRRQGGAAQGDVVCQFG